MKKGREYRYFHANGRLYRMTPRRFDRLIEALGSGLTPDLDDKQLWGAFDICEAPMPLGLIQSREMLRRRLSNTASILADRARQNRPQLQAVLEQMERERVEWEAAHAKRMAELDEMQKSHQAETARAAADLESRISELRSRRRA